MTDSATAPVTFGKHDAVLRMSVVAALSSLIWGVLSCGVSAGGPGSPGHAAKPEVSGPRLIGLWHRVQPGQTLNMLSQRYGVPRIDIAEINGIDAQYRLKADSQLFIPGKRPGSRSKASRQEENPVQDQPAFGLIWPIRQGQLTTGFSREAPDIHEGIDIAAAAGTAVLAAADGFVVYSGAKVRGYGNLILVRHEGGFVTVYAHNRVNLVREQTEVHQGDIIAEVGQTGRADGTHLHFEIRRRIDEPVDPGRYLRADRFDNR